MTPVRAAAIVSQGRQNLVFRGIGVHSNYTLRNAPLTDGWEEVVVGPMVIDHGREGRWEARPGGPDHQFPVEITPLNEGLKIYDLLRGRERVDRTVR